MKYFRHMSDLSRDEDVSRYLDAAGKDRVTAYGFLMLLLEAIASRMDWREGDLICSATYSIRQWGRITYSHANRVTKYLGMCEVIGWVEVEFDGSSCTVTVPKMKEWRDEYSRKSGHTLDKVAQRKEKETKENERENKDDDTLSDGLTAMVESRSPPPDFKVTMILQEWAASNYSSVNLRQETDKFIRHEYPKPRANWDAAWKTWIQWAAEYQERKYGAPGPTNKIEELLKLGSELGMQKQSDESDAQYCDRVAEYNQRRIDELMH